MLDIHEREIVEVALKERSRSDVALRFLKPYTGQIVIAAVALTLTASAMLSLGQGIRIIIDSGFASGEQDLLTNSLLFFGVVALVLTVGTYIRFYFVLVLCTVFNCERMHLSISSTTLN